MSISLMTAVAVGIPVILGASAFIPKSLFEKKDERKNIGKIFENMRLGIPPKTEEGEYQYPKFKQKYPLKDGDKYIGTNYQFAIPLGFPATKITESDAVRKCISDGLNKPVDVEFDYITKNNGKYKFLQVKVYDEDLPALVPYSEVPMKKGWLIPLGKSIEGFIFHNFDHVPHMTIAGTTRFGKTVLLKNIMTYLIENHSEDIEFFIVDMKGGLEFATYDNLNQVISIATDIPEAYATLEYLHELIHAEMRKYRKQGYSNVVNTPIKKRRFIIVDEAAQLTPEKYHSKDEKHALNSCLFFLSEIARMGGGVGFRLIYATQYPTADTLPRQVKMNSDGKVTFRLGTGYASEVAIDERGAERLPSDLKGRAIYKTHETTEVQVPYLSDDEMFERLKKHFRKHSKFADEDIIEMEEFPPEFIVVDEKEKQEKKEDSFIFIEDTK